MNLHSHKIEDVHGPGSAGFQPASTVLQSNSEADAHLYADFLKQNLPHANLHLDASDKTWILRDSRENIVGHFSIWYESTPALDGKKVGYIGHYFAKNARIGNRLLEKATAELRNRGCEIAVGPVDGNTWRRYRLVCGTTGVPRFLMEPENPMEYPAHFISAGFETLATYSSSIIDAKPDFIDANMSDDKTFFSEIKIRSIDLNRFEQELRSIYSISCNAFADNFLYSEISEFEFLSRYRKMLPLVIPDLVLIAEDGNRPVGFVMAVPDPANSNGTIKTAIVKTIGRLKDDKYKGLGLRLMAECHARADKLGFTHLIHALYKDDNTSGTYSTAPGAEVFRRYAVYGKELG